MGKHIPKKGSCANKDMPSNYDFHIFTSIHILFLGFEHFGILQLVKAYL
jgi:hypothetical protein